MPAMSPAWAEAPRKGTSNMTDHARPGADDAAVISIHFSRDVGWAGHEAMELARGYPSTVDSAFGAGAPAEIGVWQTTVPEAKFSAVLARLQASGYDRLDGPSTLMPDMKTVSIGLRRDGQSQPVMILVPVPGPPALKAAIDAIEAAMTEVRKHPVRVIRGEVSCREPHVARGGALALSLVLTNVGRQAVEIGNPAGREAGEWCGVRLAFEKPGQSDQQLDLVPADLHPSIADKRPTLSLAPGERLVLELRKVVEVSAGDYTLRVEYHDMTGETSEPSHVGGTLQLSAGKVKVTRGSWWKPW
jgi:hypothetical protein